MDNSAQQPAAASYEKDKVIKIINSVIQKVGQAETVSRETIYNELAEVQKIIEDARKEVGLARPDEISDKHIPTATDELDAVIESTAEATGAIMDACDVISEKAAGTPAETEIVDAVTKIYEACSFQDITGQRITKVVKTLQEIEAKVGKLVGALAQKFPGGVQAKGVPDEEEGAQDTQGAAGAVSGGDGGVDESGLLNGPQMPDKAITQDDIDKILADFD